MSNEDKKVKKQSKLLLRFTVLVLLIVVILEAYIILKTRRFIEEHTAGKGIVKFVESEFEKDKKNVEELFDGFLRDTSYKGKPVKEIIKKDVKKVAVSTKENFDDWYKKRFGESDITHTTNLKGNSVIMTVFIRGVKKESVDITVQNDIIKLSGELKGREKDRFTHSILVPVQADPESSKVDFDAGVNKIDIIFRLKG